MCVVSAVGDYWKDDFNKKWPEIYEEAVGPKSPNYVLPIQQYATKEDIDAIRKEILELKELLKAAIKFDSATDQDHCENENKIALIKKVADAVGVDLKDLNLN